MCNFFSGLITRFGDIYSNGETIKHEDLVEQFHVKDKGLDYFARWEIIPVEKGGYSNPINMDNWVFKIDEKELPSWWEEEFETKCWRHFKSWMNSTNGEDFKKKIKGKSADELNLIYTKGGPKI